MKIALIILIIALCFHGTVYAWTEYKNVRYMDMDGDLVDEIIIECKHGVGIGHYIEDIRIFKDKDLELELIFTIETLDSYSGYISPNFPAQDVVSDVEFTEQTPENKGMRDIIVKSKKIYYKDEKNKVVDKKEDLGTKAFRWDGKTFAGNKVTNKNWAQLTDYQKTEFIKEVIEKIKTQHNATVESFRIQGAILALDGMAEEMQKGLPDVEIPMIDILFDLLAKGKHIEIEGKKALSLGEMLDLIEVHEQQEQNK